MAAHPRGESPEGEGPSPREPNGAEFESPDALADGAGEVAGPVGESASAETASEMTGADGSAEAIPGEVAPEEGVPEASGAAGSTEAILDETAQQEAALVFYRGLRRTPFMTYILIAANGLVFLLLFVFTVEWRGSGLFRLLTRHLPTADLLRFGAQSNLLVGRGEYWRLITSCFLHGFLLHLLFNLYALKILGKIVENIYGSLNFLALCTFAGLTGGLGTYLFEAPHVLSVGASGAIFGLIGAGIVFCLRHRRRIPGTFFRRATGMLILWTVLILGLGLGANYLKDRYGLGLEINNAAHIGGLMGGAVLGLILPPKILSPTSFRGKLLIAFASFFAVFAILYGFLGLGLSLVLGHDGSHALSQAVPLVEYRSAKYGFSVRIPRYWRVREAKDGYLRFTEGGRLPLQLLCRDQGAFDHLETAARLQLEDLRDRKLDAFCVLRFGKTSLGGLEAHEIVVTYRSFGSEVLQRRYVVFSRGRVYTLVFLHSKGKGSEEKLVERVCQSFRPIGS
jgi:membrane associated rhomboid family serine protease